MVWACFSSQHTEWNSWCSVVKSKGFIPTQESVGWIWGILMYVSIVTLCDQMSSFLLKADVYVLFCWNAFSLAWRDSKNSCCASHSKVLTEVFFSSFTEIDSRSSEENSRQTQPGRTAKHHETDLKAASEEGQHSPFLMDLIVVFNEHVSVMNSCNQNFYKCFRQRSAKMALK